MSVKSVDDLDLEFILINLIKLRFCSDYYILISSEK